MKLFRVLALFSVLVFPLFLHAQIYINEVQVSPTTERFLELYNAGDSAVDLTGWYMQRKTSTGTSFGSLVSNPNFENKTIDAHSYFVISKNALSSSNIVLGSLTLTESNTVQIKNSNGDVVDSIAWGASCTGSCPQNPPESQSIQKAISGWIVATPTPGTTNDTTAVDTSGEEPDSTATDIGDSSSDSSSSSSSSSSGAHSAPVPLSDASEKMEFQVSAGRDRLTTVGNKLSFKAVTTKIQSTSVSSGTTYFWSFGDGKTGQGDGIIHSYTFPGEYEVVLNGYHSGFQAVSRTTVKVVSPKVSLSRVVGGVEVTNASGVEINLEGWNLAGRHKIFVFPADTLIGNNKKVIFADDVTGIGIGGVQLISPIGRELAKITVDDPPVMAVLDSVSVIATTSDMQAQLDEAQSQLAELSSRLFKQRTEISVAVVVQEEVGDDEVLEVLTPEIPETITQTATVFVAPSSPGFVSTIFSWPIRGFNFIKHLFIED